VLENGPERSRARRSVARRSEPLTARTVLRASGMRERKSTGEITLDSLASGVASVFGRFWTIRPYMGNIVVIAEKPSVAREIARVLGCRQQGEGYVGGNGYVVTWAVGHLVGLAQPQDMDPKWKSWDLGVLPMFPAEWRLSVLPRTKDQFEIVARLINASDTVEVVCATDAGREGELIFRNIYEAAGCKKVVQRLWISSLTEEAIREGFGKLRPSADYDALAAAARGRARADWLVGLNLTRAYTPRGGGVVSVGRVQTPTLAMIVDRDGEIERFVPEAYGEIEAVFRVADGGTFRGKLVRRDAVGGVLGGVQREGESAGAKNVFCVASGTKVDPVWLQSGAVIERVEEARHREGSPLLYDLTELQRHANRVFGMSAQETLDAAQGLYEKKALTYPRTDSRYIPADVGKTVSKLGLSVEWMYQGAVAAGTCAGLIAERFVDDAKVTDHHAILPTSRRIDVREVSENEGRIYDLVCRRLLSCWLPEYVSAVTTVLTWTAATEGKDLWVTKGTVLVQQGWKVLEVAGAGKEREAESEVEAAVPVGLARGIQARVESVNVRKKKTRPPARFTEASLLTAMESAGKTLDEAELSEAMRERGLGTPATRAATIELLIQREYMERRKKQLHSTGLGRSLIGAVAPELRSAELTGRWEAYLKTIERGGLASRERWRLRFVERRPGRTERRDPRPRSLLPFDRWRFCRRRRRRGSVRRFAWPRGYCRP
jgi:DNA topoisomerase-3